MICPRCELHTGSIAEQAERCAFCRVRGEAIAAGTLGSAPKVPSADYPAGRNVGEPERPS